MDLWRSSGSVSHWTWDTSRRSLAEDQISHGFPWLSCGTLPQQQFPDLSGNPFGCCPACLPPWHPVRGRVNWVLSHSTGSVPASLGSSETDEGPERFILPGLFFQKFWARTGSHWNYFPEVNVQKVRIEKGFSYCHPGCAEMGVPLLFPNSWWNGVSVLLSTHLSEVGIRDEVVMEGLGVDWRVKSRAG